MLVVTLTDESASASARHVFRQDLRAEAVAALACVDYVAVGKSNHPSEAIQLVRPDVFVPADADADEEDDSTASPGATTEDAILRALGVRVVQIKNSGLKSAAWKHQYSPAFPAESSGFLGPFCSRYSAEAVCERLQQVRSLRVLFLGEAIIDEYRYQGKSAEAGRGNMTMVPFFFFLQKVARSSSGGADSSALQSQPSDGAFVTGCTGKCARSLMQNGQCRVHWREAEQYSTVW